MGLCQSKATVFKTRILPVNTTNLGSFEDSKTLEKWELPKNTENLKPLQEAAKHLKITSIPIGFPTETVYGLGADATRSDAVKGIYKAKGRPSDNPLIIHVCDLSMLRGLLAPGDLEGDLIPEIYKDLITKFWPGPLTILLPNPSPTRLAPEVTAGLSTFGARMPDSPLALSLIKLAGVPLAAPSANASTKPSPTQAEHVRYDLDGRIEIILDGGACQVGVESTVVDGLCDPPVVLRPGGVSIDRIRECAGWEGVVKGYQDQSELGSKAPRAPGMKYKHYSPKAKVILYETGTGEDPKTGIPEEVQRAISEKSLSSEIPPKPLTIGVVSTQYWKSIQVENGSNLIEIALGGEVKSIAHGLFSALRELDQKGVDVIYVEGISDEGDIAAAVMNRLRKAASVIEK